MFNESQFLRAPNESGLAHTFGMDFFPAQGWRMGFTLSDGELTNRQGGEVDRRAASVSGGRTSPDTDWQSKIEWRKDSGFERREQWVTTNRITHKIDESWRIAARRTVPVPGRDPSSSRCAIKATPGSFVAGRNAGACCSAAAPC